MSSEIKDLLAYYGKPFIERHKDKIKPEILALYHRPQQITWEEYQQLWLNSYERELLISKLDDDCLIQITEFSINNCNRMSRPEIPATYDEAVIHRFVPELIRRLKGSEIPRI